jgi:tyrosyl-tRNA synthetase
MKNMSLSEELTWRGFINQTTFSDIDLINKTPLKFYHGYDAASADSLTIGNLAAVMMDKVFLRHGIKGVILAGGATSLIGDPGGKNSERPLQTEEVVRANVESVRKQLSNLLGSETELVNNLDWFKDMSVITFLRDVGKYFSMTPIIQRDYIAKRIGKDGAGISYTELSYTLLQGYDFLHLFDKYQVNLQLAGSDQWGNALSGVELVKKTRNAEVNVITCPLIINQATGVKFGKSETGAIWLDSNKTPVVDFYQFWINCDDTGAESYLKVYTELSKDEIDQIVSEHTAKPHERIAQKRLALEVTKLVHGAEEANKALQSAQMYSNKSDITTISDEDLNLIRNNERHLLVSLPISTIEVITKTGLASSNSEARRLLMSGAIYINGTRTVEESLRSDDFVDNKLIIRRGKASKDSALIELQK